MKYITFNNDKISKLSLGTVSFGQVYGVANKFGVVNQSEVNNILDYLILSGINSFDTAKSYDKSEVVIGNYFGNHDTKNLNIVSKISSSQLKDSKIFDIVNDSLMKLNINSLFALLLHDTNILHNDNFDIATKISKLKDEGYIKYFGVSIYEEEEFNLALKNDDINIIQIPFNIFDQRAIHKNWFKKARDKNKLIFIRSIYLQGLLLMKNSDIPASLLYAKNILKKLDDFSISLNIDKNRLCMSFVDYFAKDSSIIFGCDTLKQAKENINNFENIYEFNQNQINYLLDTFKDISVDIYDPRRW
jgi:aryl-alcohol dehydrogenase-like predicted oxidoreductase